MARGFLAGAIWGLVVSGVGAGALSVAMGPPANRPAPPEMPIATDPVAEAVDSLNDRAAPVTGTATETTRAAPDSEPRMTEAVSAAEREEEGVAETAADAVPGATTAPPPEREVAETAPPPLPARRPTGEQEVDTASAGPALSAPSLVEGSDPDTRPLQRPEAIPAPDAPNAPGTSEVARLAVGGDAPVQPGLPALPPQAPMAEAQPALSTDPAQPPQPSEDVGLAAEPEDAPQDPGQEANSDIPEKPDATPEPAQQEPAPRVTVLTPERPAEATQPAAPGIGRPATSLIDRSTEQTEPADSGAAASAPRVGTAAESRLPAITESPATRPAPQQRPLHLYGAASDLAADAPAMSIVLIDDGVGPLGPETVEAFPFPVSFAISPDHPDPAAAAAGYRARGFEVLALADLPQNATPADAEVALEGALHSVPEAVAVLESADLALQHNREISEQAAGFLAASGHGLVLMPNGLNTAEALARRAGVPSLTIFRDFDGNGQDPRVMRRFLDQAAFKARQEENVVMLGRLRADTVSALLLWGLQDRATSVALVPVSALLLRQSPEN
ncbi:divergent polysaccharide deacetylase family protein [Salipiger mangrovisoli]|uniref:Divergent polysaccharide deacetylase family protein n=1 Tax=Salipiger mangrovisoli TaxID=2865933 RepID=A0ABR9WWZ9_9RHOB|nr:divergent polysaccharide deacetylase family protein [Salipiger mangrovisoli]MBE9635824.1 divergent polysaccharide deacetylase family protein [Salipiger mangrovisoli]